MVAATLYSKTYYAGLSIIFAMFLLLTVFCIIWCILITYFAIKKRQNLILLNHTECPFNGVLMAELEFSKYNTQVEYIKLILIALICAIETISNLSIVCVFYFLITDLTKAIDPLLLNSTISTRTVSYNKYLNLFENPNILAFNAVAKCLYLVSFPMVGLLMYYLKQSYLAKQPTALVLSKWIVFFFCVSSLFFMLLIIKCILFITKPLFAMAVLISVIGYFINFIELYKVLKKRHRESILFDCENKTEHNARRMIYRRFFILALAFGLLAIILWLYVVNDTIDYCIKFLYTGEVNAAFNVVRMLGFLCITSFGMGFDVMNIVGVSAILSNMASTFYKRRKRTYRYKVGTIKAYERITRMRLLENGNTI